MPESELRMSEARKNVVAVGEVLIEFARGGDGRYALSCGGDAFNTAIYLARAGIDVSLATALGDDVHSDSILALTATEGVGRELMLRLPGRLPGINLLSVDANGARVCHSWRAAAPARELFEVPAWPQIAEGLVAARMIYFSGITLSLYSNTGIGRFLAILELAREKGAKIAFDGNFRPRDWANDIGRVRAVFLETLKRVDVALPAFDDEAALWGDASPEATVDRLQAFGIDEIVVKNGPNGALIASSGGREHVPVPEVIEPVDPTAAGDGFNAGYLAERLRGRKPRDAVFAAHHLAGQVIRHRGGIMPRPDAVVH